MTIEELVNLILYGDVHETPLSILDGFSEAKLKSMDVEQTTRLSIAATLKDMANKDKLKVS